MGKIVDEGCGAGENTVLQKDGLFVEQWTAAFFVRNSEKREHIAVRRDHSVVPFNRITIVLDDFKLKFEE